MADLVDVTNDLTPAQRLELSNKLEKLMAKYGTLGKGTNDYFEGVADGLNNAYKLVNEINDDYNATDFLTTGDEDGLQ